MMPRGVRKHSTSCLGTSTSCVDTGTQTHRYAFPTLALNLSHLCSPTPVSADCVPCLCPMPAALHIDAQV